MYSILTGGGKQKKTAAGIKRCVRDRELNHELYRNTLFNNINPSGDYHINQMTFRSHRHTIYTVDQNRVGLTRYDDKRWVLPDGINTRPHGHYLNCD